jgi:DNA polymerase (family 10)
MHTTWSDGAVSIEEMVDRSASLGREYVAITDHSVGLAIARGMDEATLLRQGVEIDRINVEGGRPRILRSIEMNLSPEGQGDMDPGILRGLDLVLGAFHSALRRREDQTARYLAAGTALEIDAFPDRQDLQIELLELAREAGTWISIGSDAHRPDELDHLELGEAAAIRAGISPARILNLRSADEVVTWAAQKAGRV